MNFSALAEKIRDIGGERVDLALIERAYAFAEEAHAGQTRKSGEDYITHPLAVASRLTEWKLDAPTIAASLLHDVAEDSPYTKQDIEKRFGEEVAFLVASLTKLKRIHYTDAASHRAENLRRMVLALAEDIRVVLIKLADRLHNMETIEFLDPASQTRIARETIEIYAPLANRLGMGQVKGELEDLSFPVIFPEEWQTLHAMVREPLDERRRYVEGRIPEIRNLLEKESIAPFDIHARAKHWYSLWKKLERNEMNLEAIHDLVALRIIVKTIEECYAVLGAIHANFPPLPGKIKDYIALPKSNGYRSLHTTVFGPEGKITEIQIRTRAMHEEAENGIAAHWAYSEEEREDTRKRGATKLARSRDLTWIKQLREWHAEFEDAGEFLESLKLDFFRDRIFVFTPKGEVIDLPEGATPVDFAYHVHSEIGDHASGAKANGKIVPLDSALANGDIVEILTQKGKRPSRDWLNFVKTALAKNHIRSALRTK